MKRFFWAVLVFAFAFSPAFGESRSWTNTEGKTLEGKIVSATDKTASVKLDNGKTVLLKFETISEEDQEYVSTWLEEQKAKKEEEKKEAKKSEITSFKWNKSYERALKEAKEYDLPVVVLFTGTSWCGYCVKLENEVLGKSKFKKLAAGKFIGVKYESVGVKEGLKGKEAKEVSQKLGQSGFPFIAIIDKDEKMLGKQGGYVAGQTPESFVKKVTSLAGK